MVMSQHLNRIQVGTLIRSLKNINLVSSEPYRRWPACVLQIVVLLHDPTALELLVMN